MTINPLAIREIIEACLYERECEVFQLLSDWKRGNEIAREMNISIKTFETYVSRLRVAFTLRDILAVRQAAVEYYYAYPEDRRIFSKQVFKGNNPLHKTAARLKAGIYH